MKSEDSQVLQLRPGTAKKINMEEEKKTCQGYQKEGKSERPSQPRGA